MAEWFQNLPVFTIPGAEPTPVPAMVHEPEPDFPRTDFDADYRRIYPPEWMREYGSSFARAEDLESFVREQFTRRGGLFWDPEHAHLVQASVGVLWSNALHKVRGAEKAGSMELLPDPYAEPRTWEDARKRDWLSRMYGGIWPTWQMTLSGVWAWRYDDRQFFGLVDHELCHAGVARDEFGAPRFNEDTNTPIWKLRPHDVETFNGTVARWGPESTGTAALVAAALQGPRFGWVPGKNFTALACAACRRRMD